MHSLESCPISNGSFSLGHFKRHRQGLPDIATQISSQKPEYIKDTFASVKQNRSNLFLIVISFTFIYIYSFFELHPYGEGDGREHLHCAGYDM